LLIKHGANVNAAGYEDNTPLHDAAMVGNQKLVKLLIDKGANPHFKNKKGKTPKDVAHQSLVSYFATLGNTGKTLIYIFRDRE
jgi:ankyrin repeat protein